MTPLKLAFVTGNAGKAKTAREHLAPLGIEVEQVTLDLDEIQSLSTQDVAMHKAQQTFRPQGPADHRRLGILPRRAGRVSRPDDQTRADHDRDQGHRASGRPDDDPPVPLHLLPGLHRRPRRPARLRQPGPHLHRGIGAGQTARRRRMVGAVERDDPRRLLRAPVSAARRRAAEGLGQVERAVGLPPVRRLAVVQEHVGCRTGKPMHDEFALFDPVPDSGQFNDHLPVLRRWDRVEVSLRVVVRHVSGKVATQSSGIDSVGRSTEADQEVTDGVGAFLGQSKPVL